MTNDSRSTGQAHPHRRRRFRPLGQRLPRPVHRREPGLFAGCHLHVRRRQEVCRRRPATRRPGSSTPRTESWNSPVSWTCWCSARRRPPTTRWRKPRWKPGSTSSSTSPSPCAAPRGRNSSTSPRGWAGCSRYSRTGVGTVTFSRCNPLVETGALGTVTRFESRFERWSPEVAKAWKAAATADDGGGVLFDLGTHLLDQALQLFGPATVTHAELAAGRRGRKPTTTSSWSCGTVPGRPATSG